MTAGSWPLGRQLLHGDFDQRPIPQCSQHHSRGPKPCRAHHAPLAHATRLPDSAHFRELVLTWWRSCSHRDTMECVISRMCCITNVLYHDASIMIQWNVFQSLIFSALEVWAYVSLEVLFHKIWSFFVYFYRNHSYTLQQPLACLYMYVPVRKKLIGRIKRNLHMRHHPCMHMRHHPCVHMRHHPCVHMHMKPLWRHAEDTTHYTFWHANTVETQQCMPTLWHMFRCKETFVAPIECSRYVYAHIHT